MIWLKGIIYKTQIPHAKACVWVFSIIHGNPFNFDMTCLKPKIKRKCLVSISKTTKHATRVCVFLLERGLCLWAGWTPPGWHLGCGNGSTSLPRAGWGRTLRCSQTWNQIFKDGIFSESPDEVARFTARFESRGTGHLCAYVVMGMEHLWYDALRYLLPVFQQKLLGCWSLLAIWPVCLHWAFTALLRTGRYWKNMIYIDPVLW